MGKAFKRVKRQVEEYLSEIFVQQGPHEEQVATLTTDYEKKLTELQLRAGGRGSWTNARDDWSIWRKRNAGYASLTSMVAMFAMEAGKDTPPHSTTRESFG